jgi:hypothetical protein
LAALLTPFFEKRMKGGDAVAGFDRQKAPPELFEKPVSRVSEGRGGQ